MRFEVGREVCLCSVCGGPRSFPRTYKDLIAEAKERAGPDGGTWEGVTRRVVDGLRDGRKREDEEVKKRVKIQVTEKRLEQALTWTAVVGGAVAAGIFIYRAVRR